MLGRIVILNVFASGFSFNFGPVVNASKVNKFAIALEVIAFPLSSWPMSPIFVDPVVLEEEPFVASHARVELGFEHDVSDLGPFACCILRRSVPRPDRHKWHVTISNAVIVLVPIIQRIEVIFQLVIPDCARRLRITEVMITFILQLERILEVGSFMIDDVSILELFCWLDDASCVRSVVSFQHFHLSSLAVARVLESLHTALHGLREEVPARGSLEVRHGEQVHGLVVVDEELDRH